MKKTIASILLGIALSVPAAYAACADLITIGPFYCVLTGSTTINGQDVCSYRCVRSPQPAPVPEQPPVRT